MARALDGIKFLDLTHMLSGPYGTMIMADMGADMVKIEPPIKGEATRRLLENDPNFSKHGMGAYFFTLNRNKRSVSIDLKTDRGLALFYQLVESADVVMNNFSAGVTRKLKIDYDTLAAINSRIITCTVTGFGESGPDFQRPAFDQIAQALGGGMSITGKDETEVVRSGIPIGDLCSGMFAVIGVLGAVVARQSTGRGQHVDISMLDCQLSMLNYIATMFSLSNVLPKPIGNSHFVHAPYDTFTTSTDPIVITVIGDNFWPPLVKMLNIDTLRDSRFDLAIGRQAEKAFIKQEMNAVMMHQSADYWLKRLRAARIPCARVNNMEQAMTDPQISARNMVVEVEHAEGGRVKVPGNPVKLSDTYEDVFTSPPLLGAHNAEVLRDWLKLSEAQIEAVNRGDDNLGHSAT